MRNESALLQQRWFRMESQMTANSPSNTQQKLTRVYSDHRQEEILYRVHYVSEEKRGCKIYTIQQVEEIE